MKLVFGFLSGILVCSLLLFGIQSVIPLRAQTDNISEPSDNFSLADLLPDIEKICRLLPPKRQTLFFSATMPPEIQRLVAQFLNDPARVEVAKPATTAKTITQEIHSRKLLQR